MLRYATLLALSKEEPHAKISHDLPNRHLMWECLCSPYRIVVWETLFLEQGIWPGMVSLFLMRGRVL